MFSNLKSNFYILDVMSSLTPYLMLFGLTSFLFFLIWQTAHNQLVYLSFYNMLGFLIGIVSLFMLTKVLNFTVPSGLLSATSVIASSGSNEYRVGFFNKLYSNTNYQDTNNNLKELGLDFVGFSELKTKDIAGIPFLKEYPYHELQEARDGSNIALYSKYLIKLDPDVEIPYVMPLTMELNQKLYHIFVVHLSPPINNSWLNDRNNQLKMLSEYINKLPNKENIIVIGDLNISVWSGVYQDFEASLPNIKNASKGKGLIFTWHNQFIKTQVDHILLPETAVVKSFSSKHINGSDHNLIWTEISV
jgi:endonuclease/exonuclease/phosphatase (EEP) superfamily protein YafD